jgi:transketolase
VVETAVAWRCAVQRHDGPSALLLTRQALAPQVRDKALLEGVERGGYVLQEAGTGPAQVVLLATGSEVQIAVEAAAQLKERGIGARVVSMPCCERFDKQPAEYRQAVLGVDLPRVAIEAGVTRLWHQYVGCRGKVIGIDRFGESAPAGELYKFFGLTADRVSAAALELLG